MTKRDQDIIAAFKKGYRVIDGKIYYKGNNPKGCIDQGYQKIGIRMENNEPRRIPVHRLVAYQKFGDKIFNKDLQVRHLNGDSLDNSCHNIGIGTSKENHMDIDAIRRQIKAGNANRKFNHKEVIAFYNSCKSYRKTMKEFGIKSLSTVSHILNHSLLSTGII